MIKLSDSSTPINPSPLFTLCAFVIILLFAACLKILFNSIVVILSDSIIS